MVTDLFKNLMADKRYELKVHFGSYTEEFKNKEYNRFRNSILDIIKELYLNASVDWDELNATMKDWR